MTEGQKGGEFFTPTSIVKLIVEIIEPFHGRIFDPACGSGGMFVQSAAFVEQHRKAVTDISIYGQEKVAETIRLCKMNLAVHGLSGDIRQGVTITKTSTRVLESTSGTTGRSGSPDSQAATVNSQAAQSQGTCVAWRTSMPCTMKITSSAILVAWSAMRSRRRAMRI